MKLFRRERRWQFTVNKLVRRGSFVIIQYVARDEFRARCIEEAKRLGLERIKEAWRQADHANTSILTAGIEPHGRFLGVKRSYPQEALRVKDAFRRGDAILTVQDPEAVFERVYH